MVAIGNAFTLIDAVALFVQPFTSVTAYVITAFPVATPVTTPEVETEATPVLLEDQTPPTVALANVVVEPSQMLFAPVIAATEGKLFTMIVVAAEVAVQPFALVTVTVCGPAVLAKMD